MHAHPAGSAVVPTCLRPPIRREPLRSVCAPASSLPPTSFTTASFGNTNKGSGVLRIQDPPGTLRGGGHAFFLDRDEDMQGYDAMFATSERSSSRADSRKASDVVSPSSGSASTARSIASFSTPFRPSNAGVSPEAVHSSHATPDSQHGGAGSNSGNPASGATAAASAQDQKRTRACESCRSLKVRCEPDMANPEGSCRRCAKARRECIFTVPTRKRQKRTDSRVAELERKINRLTATLNARRRGENEPFRDWTDSESDDEPKNRKYPASRTGSSHGLSGGHATTGGDHDVLRESEPKRQRLMSKDAGSIASRRSSSAHDMEDVSTETSATFGARMDYPSSASAPPKSQFAVPRHTRHRMPTPETDPSSITSPAQGAGEDVIDRKLLSMELATKMFDHYNKNLAPLFPAVTFPAGTTAADVRKMKPFLFLAILAAASSIFDADLSRLLNKEVMRGIADRVIISGEKNLEIIQVINIATLWYYPPDQFEELKFYQLTHIAAVMAIDCGLNKPSRSGRMRIPWMPGAGGGAGGSGGPISMNDCGGLHKIQQIMMHVPMPSGEKDKHFPRELQGWKRTWLPDPSTIESRRTFLTCYWMCSNLAMSLRRPNLLRYSEYIGECVDFIEKSPEATINDKIICQWVKLQRITEEVGIAFGYEDSVAKVNLAETRIQFALKGFERQLEEWEKNLPTELETKTVRLASHTLSLFMHEVALHGDHSVDDFRMPFMTEKLIAQPESVKPPPGLSQLTQTHINALFTCLSSAHGLLDRFLQLTVDEMRCLPVLFFARVAYSVVLLIKIFFSASASNSEVGKVIDKPQLKLDSYFEKLLALLKAASADDKSKPAAKFYMILTMLNHWYQYQKRMGSKGTRRGSVVVPPSPGFRNEAKKTDGPQYTPRASGEFRTSGGEPSASASSGIHIPTPHSTGGAETPQPSNDTMVDAPTPLQILSDVATTKTEDAASIGGSNHGYQPNANMMNIDSGNFGNMGIENVNTLYDGTVDENWMTNPLDMSSFGMGELGFGIGMGMGMGSLSVNGFPGIPDLFGGNISLDNLFSDTNAGNQEDGFFDQWPQG
ncbi:hypothetical protein Dda_2534 [Drechslerella dactyloides]|uniref:Zn(2)-C6 fungal-type domain-containing protein n=1 Tax=Drechslerella dactyloides TaxID=74499 RepID=A0AAD6J1Z8_DREDA|nr:hypothetical protein Dda_2534 [Drechslerella dactyloides]